jgi:hypothetical protein
MIGRLSLIFLFAMNMGAQAQSRDTPTQCQAFMAEILKTRDQARVFQSQVSSTSSESPCSSVSGRKKVVDYRELILAMYDRYKASCRDNIGYDMTDYYRADIGSANRSLATAQKYCALQEADRGSKGGSSSGLVYEEKIEGGQIDCLGGCQQNQSPTPRASPRGRNSTITGEPFGDVRPPERNPRSTTAR